MRLFCAVLAATLFVTAAQAESLAPGRPAGVRPAARLSGWQEAGLLTAGALILAGGGVLLSGKTSVLGSTKIASDQVPFTPPSTAISTGTN